MTTRHRYSGTAPATTLAGAIGAADLSFTVTAGGGSGYPSGAGDPFIVTLEKNVAGKEEKIACTSRAGDVFTVLAGGRGYDGTSATTHAIGASVEHTISAVDVDEINAHAANTALDEHTQYLNTTRHDTEVHSVAQPVRIRQAGVNVGLRPAINLVAGAGVTIAAADDAGNQETDVTITTVVPEGRAKAGATTYYTIPGVDHFDVTSMTLTANRLYYVPFLVMSKITLDRLATEVVAAAGTNHRVGIYLADGDWQPSGAPLVDSGNLSSAGVGVKTAAISVTLNPGRYLFALVADGAVQLRCLRGGASLFGFSTALGATPFNTELYVAFAYAALPTGTAWTTVTNANTPGKYPVFARVLDPVPA